jgi:hypothetical protein
MTGVTIPEHVLRTLLLVAFERCPARLLTNDEADQLWDAAIVAQDALNQANNYDVIGRVTA